MRPGEILDCQADLIERTHSSLYQGYLASMIGANQLLDDHDPGDEKQRVAVAAALRRTTEASYAYRVTPDMCQLVRFAASQLDDTDEFDASLAPTGCGIIRFEDPLPIRDIRGQTILISWVVWGQLTTGGGKHGMALWEFNDGFTDPDDIHRSFWEHGEREGFTSESLERLRRGIGRWELAGIDLVPSRDRLGPEVIEPGPEQAASLALEGVEALPGTNVRRLIYATWLLLNQTVTKVEDEGVDRPARRRAVRAKIPPRVTVIRLRRAEGSARREGESHVEWQHRWIVRGHWRWQACGPNRSERRRIWIHPFVKGPEDAPFRQSEKIYSLDR